MTPPAAFMLPLYLLYTRVIRVGDWSLFDTRSFQVLRTIMAMIIRWG